MTNDIDLIAWVTVRIPISLSFDSDEPLPNRCDMREIALENFLDHPAITSDDIPTLEGYVDSITIESIGISAQSIYVPYFGNLMEMQDGNDNS